MGNTFMFLLMALNTALSSQEELKTTDQQTTSTHRINVERQRTEVDSLYDEMNLGKVLKYDGKKACGTRPCAQKSTFQHTGCAWKK